MLQQQQRDEEIYPMIEIPDDYAAKGLDGHCCGEWSPDAITPSKDHRLHSP